MRITSSIDRKEFQTDEEDDEENKSLPMKIYWLRSVNWLPRRRNFAWWSWKREKITRDNDNFWVNNNTFWNLEVFCFFYFVYKYTLLKFIFFFHWYRYSIQFILFSLYILYYRFIICLFLLVSEGNMPRKGPDKRG